MLFAYEYNNFLLLKFKSFTGDGNRPVCTKMTCPQRFERLIRSGASISIVSIASVFAVTLMIVTL